MVHSWDGTLMFDAPMLAKVSIGLALGDTVTCQIDCFFSEYDEQLIDNKMS